jgi:hypothetical protein
MNEYWEEVLKQTTELMEIAQTPALNDSVAQWDHHWEGGGASLGQRHHTPGTLSALIRGRRPGDGEPGIGDIARRLLQQAEGSLLKAKEMDPNSPNLLLSGKSGPAKGARTLHRRGNLDNQKRLRRRVRDPGGGREGDRKRSAGVHQLCDAEVCRGTDRQAARHRIQMQALQAGVPGRREFPERCDASAVTAEFYSVYSAYLGSTAAAEALSPIDAAEKAAP